MNCVLKMANGDFLTCQLWVVGENDVAILGHMCAP